MNVRVFINDCWTVGDDPESHWFGYRDWHEPFLRLAIEYEVPVGRDNDVLEEAFRLFNVDESDERALRYRADRNRSLSVGDVVEINGRRYACQMVGWESISCGEDGHEWETNYPLRECLTCGLVNEAPEPIYGGEDE